MMTQQGAIEVLAEFRKAFRALNPVTAQQAVNALLNSGPVMGSGFRIAGEFASAMSALRSAFDAMDRKGIQFPSK
jgi:hypothetical protein